MFRQKWTQAWFCVLLLTVLLLHSCIFLVPTNTVSALSTSTDDKEWNIAAKTIQSKTVGKKSATKKKSSVTNKTTSGQSSAANLSLPPTVTADAAVLMDSATGDILFNKQATKKRPPASTTKIMTAILGIELGRPDELVTVSQKAAAVGESTIHLDPGEKIPLYELITGALIKSGNDACVAIGEQIAGSEEQFVKMMNQKALSLGAKDTNFVNTNGLPNKNHYSTAYDLALMARYGLRIPAFSSITRQKETEIHFIEPDFFMDLKNTNKLLWNYPFADGVKTGTTNAAGKCLVASATKDGRQLIAVLLYAPNRFGDAQKLLEWGFAQTETVRIAKAGEVVAEFPIATPEPVKAFVQYPLEVTVQKKDKDKIEKRIVWNRQANLPIRVGEELGVFEVWVNEQKLKSAPIFSEGEVKNQGLVGKLINR